MLLAGVIWQVRYLSTSLGGELHDFRQAQTTLVVREFMRHGFDWRTPLPLFGHGSHAPMELPLFQGLAALVGRVLDLSPETATRTTAFAFFQLTAVVMAWLARHWFSRTAALWTLVLVELLPYGTQWGHAALIEFMPTALVLLAVALLSTLVPPSRRLRRAMTVAAVVVLLVLAFAVKVTTGVALAPLVLVPALEGWPGKDVRARLRSLVLPGGALAVAVLAAAVWTSVADHVKRERPRTEFLTSAALKRWNFGTRDQRLTLSTWTHVVDGYWAAIVGGALLLLVIAVVAVLSWRWRPVVLVLVVTPFVGPLVFTNLFWVHSYYSVAPFPVLVLLAAAAIDGARRRLAVGRDRALVTSAALSAVLLMAWTSPEGAGYRANLHNKHEAPGVSREIQAVVPSGSGIVTLGCDWNPVVVFYADRPALMLGVGGNPVMRAGRAELAGFGYVAFCTTPAGGYDAALEAALPPGTTTEQVAPDVFRFTLAA